MLAVQPNALGGDITDYSNTSLNLYNAGQLPSSEHVPSNELFQQLLFPYQVGILLN